MTDEIIKQEPPQKKFNWANLPIILVIYIYYSSFILTIGLIPIFIILEDNIHFFNALMIPILIYCVIWLIIMFLCPVSLIFQILNKNKTIMDKVLLGINVIFCILFVLFFIFCSLAED
jgi:hypothetical protein